MRSVLRFCQLDAESGLGGVSSSLRGENCLGFKPSPGIMGASEISLNKFIVFAHEFWSLLCAIWLQENKINKKDALKRHLVIGLPEIT